eukprot:8288841-Alexandrium_andersonii.AAC.1
MQGLSFLANASLFSVLWELVQSILNCSDSECLKICHLRSAFLSKAEPDMSEVVLEMDEAVRCLGHDERTELE